MYAIRSYYGWSWKGWHEGLDFDLPIENGNGRLLWNRMPNFRESANGFGDDHAGRRSEQLAQLRIDLKHVIHIAAAVERP